MNGKELIKKCEVLGWYVDRIEGSHHIMKHTEYKHSLSIPVHGSKDLKKGILHELMKKAGLK